jgi:cell division protein FtsB
MRPVEILALIQAARSLLDLGILQYRLAEQGGRLTDKQRAAILEAADLTDDGVDAVVAAARQRLGLSVN